MKLNNSDATETFLKKIGELERLAGQIDDKAEPTTSAPTPQGIAAMEKLAHLYASDECPVSRYIDEGSRLQIAEEWAREAARFGSVTGLVLSLQILTSRALDAEAFEDRLNEDRLKYFDQAKQVATTSTLAREKIKKNKRYDLAYVIGGFYDILSEFHFFNGDRNLKEEADNLATQYYVLTEKMIDAVRQSKRGRVERLKLQMYFDLATEGVDRGIIGHPLIENPRLDLVAPFARNFSQEMSLR